MTDSAKSTKKPNMNQQHPISGHDSSDLFGQTLRTVGVLVGACVVFMGVLSTAAVLITSKAVGPSTSSAPSTESAPVAAAPKKPVSI